MSLKKVLVTGATGQIGNAVFMRLKEQPEKYDVYALDRSATAEGRRELLRGVRRPVGHDAR